MNRSNALQWISAFVAPPLISAVAGVVYDWEITLFAAALGLLTLPSTLLFTELAKKSVINAAAQSVIVGIALGLLIFGWSARPGAEGEGVSMMRFCLSLYLITLALSLIFLISLRLLAQTQSE